MRTYYDITLGDRTIARRELSGEAIVKAGRYLIARPLLDLGVAAVAPPAPTNPLVFSAGPFAGTSFSNANRTCVGCKSPLTGGVKEANGGGTFGYALGQLKIAGVTLRGASPDWAILHFKNGAKMLQADGFVTNFYQPLGTMGMADVQNQMGGLPVRNFSAGLASAEV